VYLATIAEYAKAHWGITFASVDAFNEPSGSWSADGTQEGCHFDIGTQSAVIPHLRSELDSRSLSTIKVSASDENTYDDAITTWNSLSASAKADIERVNVHGYEEQNGRRNVLYSDAHGAGKLIWNSEYGENDATGRRLVSNIILDLIWLHPVAWVYWQALDGGGWGLATR